VNDRDKLPSIEAPELRFYRIYETAQKPILADASAKGLLPVRAYRYCEAARRASAIGWYVFPPVAFSVLYDGAAVFWRFNEQEDWRNLDDVVLSSEAQRFDAVCPDLMQGHCPPFLGAAEEGMLQISTGMALRTNSGWGVLIRKPPNVPQKNHLNFFEGFVETDTWFGPLFINLKPVMTNVTIRFQPDWPIAFVQPVPNTLIKLKLEGRDSYVPEIADFSDEDWSDLGATLTKRVGPNRVIAQYARSVRKKSH